MSSRLAKYSDPFLKELIRRQIDFFNITAFLRVKFWGREDEKEFLGRILIDGGMVEKKRLLGSISQPASSLREVLHATDYSEAIEKALKEWENKYSLFSLDKFFDRYILDYTKRGFYITFGREPLVNYIFLKKQEIKSLRGILRGKFAGLPQDKMEKYLII
jgi:V/A-type H+-transporting ATPase subunit C